MQFNPFNISAFKMILVTNICLCHWVESTRLTQRVQLVEQELLTLRVHMSSPPIVSGVRVQTTQWTKEKV
jgi:hypothetical protein